MKKKIPALLLAACLLLSIGALADPAAQNIWVKADGIWQTAFTYTDELDTMAGELDLSLRADLLMERLMADNGAFVADMYNYEPADETGTPTYEYSDRDLPIEISPNGYSIRVSPGYFDHNPAETADGRTLEESIIDDDMTMNVLVPEQYKAQEADILDAYREIFYFEKVEVANLYNEELGLEARDTTAPEDLSVNLIYMKEGQYYFTYSADAAADSGNIIADPMIMLYQRNIHPNYALSFLTRCTYFPSDAEDAESAYADIADIVKACGMEESITKVRAVTE